MLLELLQGREDILHSNLQNVVGKPGGEDIFAEHPSVSFRAFHANGRDGSATEGFQTQSTGSGKQLEDARPGGARAEAVENRLLDEIGGWAHVQAFGHFEALACGFATSDAHHQRLRGSGVNSQQVLMELKLCPVHNPF
jgi:hypothetical protein